MLIVGAKGFAKEILGVLDSLNLLEKIAFFDDVSDDIGDKLYDFFPILNTMDEVKSYFSNISNKFTLGVGNPQIRFKLYNKFRMNGGEFSSTISPNIEKGNYDVNIGIGCNVLGNSVLSNSISIGKGCIIYYNVQITHDCIINDFVELSPNSTILGNVKIGSFTQIGANTTILPKIKIGSNVIIGAGSVVTKDIPNNCMAYGVPARIIRELEPIQF